MTSTETQLIGVLTKGLRLSADRAVSPETPIFGPKGLGLDSVDVLEVAVLVDKHFGVVLEERNEEVNAALASVGALAAYIDRHKKA